MHSEYLRASGEGRDGANRGDEDGGGEFHFDLFIYLISLRLKVMRMLLISDLRFVALQKRQISFFSFGNAISSFSHTILC